MFAKYLVVVLIKKNFLYHIVNIEKLYVVKVGVPRQHTKLNSATMMLPKGLLLVSKMTNSKRFLKRK